MVSKAIPNTSSTPTLTSSFVGYFYVPGPLWGLKSVPGDVLEPTDSIGTFFSEYLLGVQKW